jgi:hypothetical protein
MNQIKFVGFGCSANHLSTARAPRSGAKCADLRSMRQEKFLTPSKPAARFKVVNVFLQYRKSLVKTVSIGKSKRQLLVAANLPLPGD